MTYDKDHHDIEENPNTPTPRNLTRIEYKWMGVNFKCYILALWAAKLVYALIMAASIAPINPVALDIFLGDFLPLPDFLGDISMNNLINFLLGILTVGIPTVLWNFALSQEFQNDPKSYFAHEPVRIAIAGLLIGTYGLLLSLEILALRGRILAEINTGPIASLGEPVQAAPMIVASTALILFSALLGLTSAVLRHSIIEKYSVPVR